MIKIISSRLFMRLLRKKPLFFTAKDVEQVMNNPESIHYQDLIKKVSFKRSYYDEMYQGDGAQYLQVGLSAIQCIDSAINESDVIDIKKILDLPSGHGRVLRFIASFFPEAEITACDINKHAVEFCRKEFGARPVNSRHSFKEFNIENKFDLIWCGSLATHINSADTNDLLSFFYRHLNIGGLLVISMHGKRTLEYLRSPHYPYSLDEMSVEKILSEIQDKGYGYADYKGYKGYGISVASPDWMKTAFEKTGNWRAYRHTEKAWDHHHDIYSAVKN